MLGAFAIYMYLFCGICLFAGYMVEYGLGWQAQFFSGWTQDALNELTGRNAIDVADNPLFVFGNFFEWSRAIGVLLFNAVTGGIVQDVFSNLPFWNEPTMLFTRFIYTFGTLMVDLSIGTGRGF